MGVYLAKPITTKESVDGIFNVDGLGQHLPYAVSEMQGWRKSMEDAHITHASAAPGVHVFAVFDGHGGKEVAAFCAAHFVEELLQSMEFRAGDVAGALKATFHRIDDMLRDERYSRELAQMRDRDDAISASLDGQPDDDDEDSSSDAAPRGGRGGSSSSSSGRDDGHEFGGQEASREVEDAVDAATALPVTALPQSREALKEEVKQRMSAAEEKGVLSKKEALQLVMNMMKLKKLSEDDETASDGSGAAVQGSGGGVTVGARYTEAGCTANVAVVMGRSLFVANAGDSRAILCRSGGAVHALSKDHKPQQPAELQRIQRAGGTVSEVGRVNGNLNLSRSIGDLRYKVDPTRPPEAQVITADPDVTETVLTDDSDFVLIACDGVFDVMSNEEAAAFVLRRLETGLSPVSAVLEELFEECICDSPQAAGGIGADNMTACLVLLKPLSSFVQRANNEEIGRASGSKSKGKKGRSGSSSGSANETKKPSKK